MVLDFLDDGAQRLLLVLCLPLVDGVFATLLVTGAIQTFSDVVNVALTIFSGAGALAVLYSSADSGREARRMVKQVTPFLLGGALVISLIAPVFASVFYMERLKYATGLAIIAIAAHILELDHAEKFPVPAIVVTGLVVSVQSPAAAAPSLEYVVPALGTAAMAVGVLYLASLIDIERMDLDYIRRGGAMVLCLIGLSQFGLAVPSELGLAVLALSVFASLRKG
ncbi:DUF5794 domain-containing protein [Candidatus Nanohalovita haloferacivicina]|uniref:DUF5794 domain-containing protein n=1 Tax=Candidatus Nanohalovita haloferacivicina TaxID=2978046 RepID=UPI00325FA1C7|nr:putative membrane protein [Candidatus Nanohalobia archaeon BNXNv]